MHSSKSSSAHIIICLWFMLHNLVWCNLSRVQRFCLLYKRICSWRYSSPSNNKNIQTPFSYPSRSAKVARVECRSFAALSWLLRSGRPTQRRTSSSRRGVRPQWCVSWWVGAQSWRVWPEAWRVRSIPGHLCWKGCKILVVINSWNFVCPQIILQHR